MYLFHFTPLFLNFVTIFCLLNFKISSHFFSKSIPKKHCKIKVLLQLQFIFLSSVTMLTIFLYICYFFKYRHTVNFLFSKSFSIKSNKIKVFVHLNLFFKMVVTIFFIFSLLSKIPLHRHAYNFLPFLMS